MALGASKLKAALSDAMEYSDGEDIKRAASRADRLSTYPQLAQYLADARKIERLSNFVGFFAALIAKEDPGLAKALQDFNSRAVLDRDPFSIDPA